MSPLLTVGVVLMLLGSIAVLCLALVDLVQGMRAVRSARRCERLAAALAPYGRTP